MTLKREGYEFILKIVILNFKTCYGPSNLYWLSSISSLTDHKEFIQRFVSVMTAFGDPRETVISVSWYFKKIDSVPVFHESWSSPSGQSLGLFLTCWSNLGGSQILVPRDLRGPCSHVVSETSPPRSLWINNTRLAFSMDWDEHFCFYAEFSLGLKSADSGIKLPGSKFLPYYSFFNYMTLSKLLNFLYLRIPIFKMGKMIVSATYGWLRHMYI